MVSPTPAAPSVRPGRDERARGRVRRHFDRIARHGMPARRRYRYYYEDLYGLIRDQVEPGSTVLDLGCGDGALLASLQPSFGVGVDFSLTAIQQARSHHPDLEFVCADVERLPVGGTFDYVIVSNVVGYLIDVQEFFRNLSRVTHPASRVIVAYYNFAWEPLLKLAEALGLKTRQPLQSWLSNDGLANLVELADMELVKSGYRTPLPIGPAAVTRPVNSLLSAVPLVNRLGLISHLTARPKAGAATPRIADPTCTVVIPARNERGNIRDAVSRMPTLGRHTEVIFVEGHSTDGTFEEIEAVIADHPEHDLKVVRQDGAGKGDAVRKGFELATGDVLMILDADLTVPPEDLQKFWTALVEERGEFINGTRLVYPMEDNAMRLANVAGNKVFSLIFSWILGERVTDTLCGTKVLWARDYQRIAANRKAFGDFDPFGDFDLLFGAANLGLKIREVPVRYRERRYGTTNIDRWRHGLLLARMALIGARKLRFR
jgi:2-polyprenyl-3-methyl-5-hydroxy-6-metoxy-1,4-benzoquinol methylase